eukprot:TRINITY_DN12453_c0_g3_i1.p1 TRINITY_DN12453_c0_g3~~TRINITY_DN12453_c0_g3_i1.p1  ORF type:complete len:390 (-),score=64.12 TRINITY_DN12453_c0_g3_i1:71-1240(-)
MARQRAISIALVAAMAPAISSGAAGGAGCWRDGADMCETGAEVLLQRSQRSSGQAAHTTEDDVADATARSFAKSSTQEHTATWSSGRDGPCDTPMSGDAMQTYMHWLDDPPCESTNEAKVVMDRADKLMAELQSTDMVKLGDLDVIVAGSSYMDRYYVGFQMILARAAELQLLSVKRTSGASSGANAPFDMLLLGEAAALTKFFTFGLLGERSSYVYWAGVADQQYWFAAIDWLFNRTSVAETRRLDDRMWLWTSCKKTQCSWWEQLTGQCSSHQAVHNFEDLAIARKVYRATGSVHPAVDISDDLKGCTDGGAGEAFKDGLHAQITISPVQAAGGWAAWRGYTIKEYSDGIAKGQDDAIQFLKSGGALKLAGVHFCQRGVPCEDPKVM